MEAAFSIDSYQSIIPKEHPGSAQRILLLTSAQLKALCPAQRMCGRSQEQGRSICRNNLARYEIHVAIEYYAERRAHYRGPRGELSHVVENFQVHPSGGRWYGHNGRRCYLRALD